MKAKNDFSQTHGAAIDTTRAVVEWVSDIQLAQRYSVSRATIWRWTNGDEHPLPKPQKIGKNCTRWQLSKVIAAMEG
ncbi:MAG: hypothetical protein VR73_13070 [Gammaproteobacteria bacterium BRH_c0]|nr:MAG: hypothetical protein VR73_13070 [Gammaproteobacteria bacterium BRH_c0]